MADSNITKRALAQALKELLQTQNFDKISVGNICEKCGMNRKSFYYHFKDKYELVNWIYFTEFISVVRKKEEIPRIELLEEICTYFYENRPFIRKLLVWMGRIHLQIISRLSSKPLFLKISLPVFHKNFLLNLFPIFMPMLLCVP